MPRFLAGLRERVRALRGRSFESELDEEFDEAEDDEDLDDDEMPGWCHAMKVEQHRAFFETARHQIARHPLGNTVAGPAAGKSNDPTTVRGMDRNADPAPQAALTAVTEPEGRDDIRRQSAIGQVGMGGVQRAGCIRARVRRALVLSPVGRGCGRS